MTLHNTNFVSAFAPPARETNAGARVPTAARPGNQFTVNERDRFIVSDETDWLEAARRVYNEQFFHQSALKEF
jgi:hypothetical protein